MPEFPRRPYHIKKEIEPIIGKTIKRYRFLHSNVLKIQFSDDSYLVIEGEDNNLNYWFDCMND